MKRFLRFVMAAVVMFGAVACSQNESLKEIGKEATTILSVNLEDLNTRLAGDSGMIDRVAWGIYEHNGQFLAPHSSANSEPAVFANGKAEIEVTLFTGKKYDLVFFAYNSGNKAYKVDWENRKLDVNYNDLSNLENRDAFFHIENAFVAGPSKTFTLKRPFAQLNVGQSLADYKNMIEKENAFIDKSSLTAYAYAAMDLTTGNVLGERQPVTLTINNVIDVDGVEGNDHLTTGGVEYKHIAMNYLLVNQKETMDVEFVFHATDNNPGTYFTRKYFAVPLQRNYRTNILGSIISDEAIFTIVIDPIFNGDHNHDHIPASSDLLLAAKLGGEFVLTKDIILTEDLDILKNLVINLNGYSITTIDCTISVVDGANVTIKGTKENSKMVHQATTNVPMIDVVNGNLNLDGGLYNSVTNGLGTADDMFGLIEAQNGSSITTNNANIYAKDENGGVIAAVIVNDGATLAGNGSEFTADSKTGLNSAAVYSYGDVELTDCRLIGKSNHTAAGNAYTATARGLMGESGSVTLNNCYAYGSHSGATVKGVLIVNGGTYEGYGLGGLFVAANEGPSYIMDAKLQMADMLDGYESDNIAGTNGAGLYIGSNSNVVVYMDNCQIYGSKQPIVLRGSSGEQNNHLYISNSSINLDYINQGVRLDNGGYLHIGKGNNFDQSRVKKNGGTWEATDAEYRR